MAVLDTYWKTVKCVLLKKKPYKYVCNKRVSCRKKINSIIPAGNTFKLTILLYVTKFIHKKKSVLEWHCFHRIHTEIIM